MYPYALHGDITHICFTFTNKTKQSTFAFVVISTLDLIFIMASTDHFCIICQGTASNAIMLQCHHVYCRECYCAWECACYQGSGVVTCPHCIQPVTNTYALAASANNDGIIVIPDTDDEDDNNTSSPEVIVILDTDDEDDDNNDIVETRWALSFDLNLI